MRSLRLSDFLAETFKLGYNTKERINIVLALQKKMDFDNLALVLVKSDDIHWRHTGDTIFPLLSDKRLKIVRRDELIVELLKAAFFQDRFDLAIKIWNTYATVVTSQPWLIVSSLIASFEKSAASFEYKAYFFHELAMDLSTVHFDRILTCVEKRLLPLES